MGAEWESLVDVTGHCHGIPSFRIRPKKLSRHGRQFIKEGRNGGTVFNVGKVGKLASMSMRPNFAVGPAEDDGKVLYTIVGDMMGRTMQVTNEKDELVAVVAKTTKALIMNAALGKGSESTIDIAAGVDCSMILAMVFGLQQVGAHFAKDAFNAYVVDNVKGQVIGGAVEAAGLQGAVDEYTDVSNQSMNQVAQLTRAARFMQSQFFN
jgi:LURP-one-related